MKAKEVTNKSVTITLKVGDKIHTGRFRNVRSEITDIKKDQYGQPVIVTSRGDKKALTFRLAKLDKDSNEKS